MPPFLEQSITELLWGTVRYYPALQERTQYDVCALFIYIHRRTACMHIYAYIIQKSTWHLDPPLSISYPNGGVCLDIPRHHPVPSDQLTTTQGPGCHEGEQHPCTARTRIREPPWATHLSAASSGGPLSVGPCALSPQCTAGGIKETTRSGAERGGEKRGVCRDEVPRRANLPRFRQPIRVGRVPRSGTKQTS